MLPARQRTVAVKRLRISGNITFRLFVNIKSSPKDAGAISCVKMPWLACTLWRNQLVFFVAVMGQCVRTQLQIKRQLLQHAYAATEKTEGGGWGCGGWEGGARASQSISSNSKAS